MMQVKLTEEQRDQILSLLDQSSFKGTECEKVSDLKKALNNPSSKQ